MSEQKRSRWSGAETCLDCLQTHHFVLERRCADCDGAVCVICAVTVATGTDLRCPSCIPPAPARTEATFVSARAIWKASLELGAVRVLVKLYAAAQDREVHFRLLHAKEPGVFVVLQERELDSIAPEPTRSIEVTRIVPAAAMDISWYSRPYFLGPDGAAEDYAALAQVMREGGLRGITRWAMRGRRYFGALAAHGRHLSLITLRPAQEVLKAAELAPPEGKAPSAGERALAEQLVAALDAPFEPSEELQDEYRERVLALIQAKAKGRRLPAVREALPKPVSDLSGALKRSLESARKHRAA